MNQEDDFLRPMSELKAYFARINSGGASDSDHLLFEMRLMQMFAAQVFDDGHVDGWVLKAVANNFCKVLTGSPWNDEFPLPWMPATPVRTKALQKGLDIFCWVENKRLADPKGKFDEILNSAADHFSASYQLVRQRYYEWRKICSAGFSENHDEVSE